MKKKIISIVLILSLLFIPFSMLLTVQAEGVTITVDANGKVTNNTGTITVYDVNTEKTSEGYVTANSDTFKAYKVIDLYYNSNTNEISYQFTTDFQGFINTLTTESTEFIRSITSPAKDTFTVEDYLKLTSDEYGDNGNATSSYRYGFFSTTSTLNVLVSKYATYIRTNEGTANAVTGLPMTNGNYGGGNDYGDEADARLNDVVPGSYLILPDSIMSRNYGEGGASEIYNYIYGVMVANVFFSANNNEWVLNDATIYAKAFESFIASCLLETTAANAELAFSGEKAVGNNLTYKNGESYSSFIAGWRNNNVPSNAHSSIKELENNYLLDTYEISYSASIIPDLTEIYFTLDGVHDSKIENDKYYVYAEDQYREWGDVSRETDKITFTLNNLGISRGFCITFNLTIDANSLSTAIDGNTITATRYVVKDPYIDIGTNVTKETLDNAFLKEGTAEDTAQYVTIRKAIAKVEQTASLDVYGLNITNKNSNNANLTGAEFAVYETYNSGSYSNQVGSNIVINNGTASFRGLEGNKTYYLKQTKAPTGYKIYDDKIIVLKSASDETVYDTNTYEVITMTNNIYTVNVVNQAIGALPFTGGEGTVIYIVIGLLLVILAIVFIVIYKKKNRAEEKLKKLYRK